MPPNLFAYIIRYRIVESLLDKFDATGLHMTDSCQRVYIQALRNQLFMPGLEGLLDQNSNAGNGGMCLAKKPHGTCSRFPVGKESIINT